MPKVDSKDLKCGVFDFVDFGCKTGGSFEFCKRILGGGRGLGIDKNPAYVNEFCESGGEAILGDVTNTGLPDNFARFVCVSHLLEHLPNWDLVEKATMESIRIARDFVYVVGPYFDADEYLSSLGLKFFWSDWSFHPTHVDSKSLENILRRHGHENFICYGHIRIHDSRDSSLHPLDSPKDQHDYDPKIHPPKEIIDAFDRPVFREMVILIPKSGNLGAARDAAALLKLGETPGAW